jgi:hypothetical protein
MARAAHCVGFLAEGPALGSSDPALEGVEVVC